MSLTDWEKLQALASELRAQAERLGGGGAFDARAVRLIQALGAIADLAEASERFPPGHRLGALLELVAEEAGRLG